MIFSGALTHDTKLSQMIIRSGNCTVGASYADPLQHMIMLGVRPMAQFEEVMRYRARAKELDQDAIRYGSAELRELALRLAHIYERLADRLEVLGDR